MRRKETEEAASRPATATAIQFPFHDGDDDGWHVILASICLLSANLSPAKTILRSIYGDPVKLEIGFYFEACYMCEEVQVGVVVFGTKKIFQLFL